MIFIFSDPKTRKKLVNGIRKISEFWPKYLPLQNVHIISLLSVENSKNIQSPIQVLWQTLCPELYSLIQTKFFQVKITLKA